MFWVPEDGIVFLDVERDVLACSTCSVEVPREEDPNFTGTGVRRIPLIVEPQVVRRNWKQS